MRILPEIPSVAAEAKRLKKDGVDILIALGHSGFDADVEIAKHVEDIDAVVGGHSNTFLYSGEFLCANKSAVSTTTARFPRVRAKTLSLLRRFFLNARVFAVRRAAAGRRETRRAVSVLGGTTGDPKESARGPGVSHHQILGTAVAGIRRGRRSDEGLRESDAVGFQCGTRSVLTI